MSTITESRERSALDAVPKRLLIAGEWREASGGATLEVEDPSTGAALCEVANASVADGAAALNAAVAAQDDWARHPRASAGRSCGAHTRPSSSARTISRC